MKHPNKKILVPIDFSSQSYIGLEQAYNLAKINNASISLLHIINEAGPLWSIYTEDEKPVVIDKLRNKILEFAHKLIKDENFKLKVHIRQGKLCETIIRISEEHDFDFIVMGTSTADNIKKKIIGSNALRVVSEAYCPVITIKGKHFRPECDNIILPLDLTKETKEKVTNALHFGRLFNAKVFVVSIVSMEDEFINKRLNTQLKQVEDFLTKGNVECSTDLIHCNDKTRSECLIDYIHNNQGDMIIITTHQQPLGILKYFMGSFAQEIIHGVDIPVMSIVPRLQQNVASSFTGL
ncbi:MAG: universal stress protein [Bacteroidetes bacterium]|nr:universal stress protein [Bacteroidota bacterium]